MLRKLELLELILLVALDLMRKYPTVRKQLMIIMIRLYVYGGCVSYLAMFMSRSAIFLLMFLMVRIKKQ